MAKKTKKTTTKPSKKPAKKSTKKTTKKTVKSSKKLAPVKKSIIEMVPELVPSSPRSFDVDDGRMDFGNVDHVFGAMISAFHPDGLEEEDTDDRFIALWTLFLNCSGWAEEEFWEEFHRREEENVCQECGETLDENGEHSEDDETEEPVKKTDLKIVN